MRQLCFEYFNRGGMFGWMGGGLMMLFPILIIVLIFYFFNKNDKNDRNNNIENPTPLDILKKRYARGEITKQEFEDMKKDIQ
ncbi:SHOCT domain-containing protein [uncultured Ilyobacter sp.]|uniref:SHOCT domain-containing protein n=1 Tax=uncultured Ilyobacter sp. TaxID=544433 RepID=UPI0029F529FA|nr:SHOCT domain-containing protein [uncultured Ilyobacter sp.]